MEPLTPVNNVPSDDIKMRTYEDSGYQTSFTPSSTITSELSIENESENIDPNSNSKTHSFRTHRVVSQTPFTNISNRKRLFRSKNNQSFPVPEENESPGSSPCSGSHYSKENSLLLVSPKKAKRRCYQESSNTSNWSFTTASSTPTSAIAGELRNLLVKSATKETPIHYDDNYQLATTPVKRSKNEVTQLSPPQKNNFNYEHIIPLKEINDNSQTSRRSVKKLIFSPEPSKNLCFSSISPESKPYSSKSFTKLDIISRLHEKRLPAIDKILGFLDSEDIYNFSLVSPSWLRICKSDHNANSTRKQYIEYINRTKENCENRELVKKLESGNEKRSGSLKDIHNLVKPKASPKRSPPCSPKSNKFKKFTKAASLDSRIQMSCVRCKQPAKITRETSGEQWAECCSRSCAYEFCRFCGCERHSDRRCTQYGLEAPSPSKRRKSSLRICSEKSRKNLRRLAF